MRETIQNANGKQFHAVSLSGGKDSTAMLLLMIEQDMPMSALTKIKQDTFLSKFILISNPSRRWNRSRPDLFPPGRF